MELAEKFPVKSEKTASRIIDGEAVIVMPEESKVRVLNEVASRIWELMDGNRSVEAIASSICGAFEVSYSKALEDTTGFVKESAQKRLVDLFDTPQK